eukprot:TRINITY_DN12486_c0_g1_i1.p2 TRINITY_DN12486_c0_g1~~TRINITY_DN12486_c0_g1_i1.p2  ORF type:complete len:275 (+),score=107.48 TRINITY_DN12486_c0_g1_i1:79-825(+)
MATSIASGAPQEAAVIVGKKRPQDNPLIGHYEVGRSWHAKMSPFHGDPTHTYGAALRRDPEGAGDVVLRWNEHVQSPPPKGAGNKDFLRLNKQAAAAHCVSPSEASEFRQAHDYRVRRLRVTKDCSLPKAVRDPGTVFGQKTKPEVSVGELIGNKFESEWIEQQIAFEQRDRAQRKARLQKKSTRRRQFMHRPPEAPPPMHPREYFTLKQFRDVPSKFRPPGAATPEPMKPPRPVILPPLSQTPEPGY